MHIRNSSNNTLYASDIDTHIPYKDGAIEEIDPDTLKKSKSLRGLLIHGFLEIVDYNPNEQIEASIVYLKSKVEAKKQKEEPVEVYEPEVTSLETISTDIEVRLHGIFFDAGGYGKVNRNLATKLAQSGIKLKVDPKHSQNQLKESELAEIIKLSKTKISKNHITIDSVIPTFAEYATGKYRILYTTIESYTVPKQFLDCCALYDEIWVTSPWSANILKKHVKKPIHVIPAGIDSELYVENGSRFNFKPNIKDFVFISVFGWSYRKGYDVLLKAYFDEFSADDNVSLLIVSRYQSQSSRFHRDKIKHDINEIMTEFPNKEMPHVVRYSQIIAEQDMPKLYRSGDCFVLPTRGEGSCLTAPEASLCGLPVIMTNVSGQQMYLRNDNAFLIEMDRLVKMRPGQMHLHYWDGQEFPALISDKVHSDLKKSMRYVYKNKDEAKKRNRNLQKLIRENFTWNDTANAAITRLQEIVRKNKW